MRSKSLRLIFIVLITINFYSASAKAEAALTVPPKIGVILNSQSLLNKGLEGQGVTIGIISNGAKNYNILTKNGFLPNDVKFPSGFGEGLEGGWMMQVAHQVAPSAHLAFCPSASQGETVKCAEQLIQKVHSQIIVYDENPQPVFWGATLQARGIESLAKQYPNVLFFTGAGNNNGGYYQNKWLPLPLVLNGVHYQAQNFGLSVGKSNNPYNSFLVPPHSQAIILMGVNKPSAFLQGKIILALLNDNGKLLIRSKGVHPIQQLRFTNDSGYYRKIRVAIIVPHKNLSVANLAFKLVILQAGLGVHPLMLHFTTPGGAGNSAFDSHILTIGAVDPGSDFRGQYLVEKFSNTGPQCISFKQYNNKMIYLNHNQCFLRPTLVAPDKTTVAMLANTTLGYALRPFAGDSAAAPAAGAAAALLLSAHIPANHLAKLLVRTANPMSANTGWTPIYGFGLINIDAAADKFGILAFKNNQKILKNLHLTHNNNTKYEQRLALYSNHGDTTDLIKLQASARKHNSYAMAWLGWYYLQKKNYQKSIKWLWESAQTNNALAQSLLGSSFNRGWGTAPDPRAAYAWWSRAAAAGDPDALYNLGTAYATGRGVKVNLTLAYALMQASLINGQQLNWEEKAMKHLRIDMSPNQHNKALHLAQIFARDPSKITSFQNNNH